ncbi:MAG: DUF2950 family protein [Planctomycetota bacterium]|jgi:hypothetical protein
MMDTNADVTGTPAPSRGEELLTGLADATLGFLVRNNLFYILSALLLLAGCFLICIPIPFGYREMWIIVLLLGVINVYEAMVILTSAYIIRRLSGAARAGPVHKGAGREVSVLLVLATVLFLDGHFTVNACLTTHFGWGLLIAGVSLVLAFVKMFALSRGARFAVFGGLKAFLVPSVVFMHTVQIVLYVNRSAAPWARELSTYLAWLALGTLPMLFLLGRFDAPEGTKDATRPRWQGDLFRKIIAAVSVAIPAALLAGQTWAHDAPFSAPLLLPLLFSIIVVAPIFRRPKNARALDANRAVLAGAALIAAGLWTRGVSWSVPVFGAELVLSPFRMDMVFGAATFLVMWRRERGAAGGQRHIGYHMAFALLALAVFGHDLGSIALSIREPHFARVAPFAALAAIWWLQGRGYARALGAASAVLFLATRAVAVEVPALSSALEFARYWPVVALAAAMALRRKDRLLRAALVAAVFLFGTGGCFVADGPALVYLLVGLGALAAAALDGGWRYAYVIAWYLFVADLILLEFPLPETTLEWGMAAVGAAFVLFGVAFLVTRVGLTRPPEEAPTKRPEAPKAPGTRTARRKASARAGRRVLSWTVTRTGILLVILFLFAAVAVPGGGSRIASNESCAIAYLRGYLSAQHMFKRSSFYGIGKKVYANPRDGVGFSDLYQVGHGAGPRGEALEMIDVTFADARWGYRRKKPKAGYYFADLEYDDYTTDCGLCAAPASYNRSGRNIFIVDVTGTVYEKDAAAEFPNVRTGDAVLPLRAYPDAKAITTWIPVGSE